MATYSGSDKRLAYLFQNGGGGGGGASALNDLSDVAISSPTDGQALLYDAQNQEWVNSTAGNPSSLASMSDVSIDTPSNGQVLTYNSTTAKWENQAGGVDHTYSTTEQVVGTWIDGKPVYELSFSQVVQGLPSNTPTNLIDLSSYAILDVISIVGGTWYETGTAADKRYLPVGSYSNMEYVDSTGYIQARQTFTSATANRTWTFIATVRFTKSTD